MANRFTEAALGAGIFVLALGVYVWGIPAWVEPSDFAMIPPDLLPRVCVGTIAVLGGWMVLHRLFLDRSTGGAGVDWPRLVKAAVLILVFACGVGLILWHGYLIGGPFVVASLMLFMGTRNIGVIAATALGAPFALFGLFDLLLGIPLP